MVTGPQMGALKAILIEKNREQWQINKELLCVHFGFAVNMTDGIGLSFAEKSQIVSGISMWMVLSMYWKPS